MNPGDLRHRIEIGYYAEGFDQWGDPLPEPEWNLVAKAWASVEGLRGNQYFQAQQMVNQSDHRIIIRYRKDIKQGLIVKHDSSEFTIQSVLDEDGRRRYLTLICQEVQPA
jgi:SPP1 family predicted phage head-tail adaptor